MPEFEIIDPVTDPRWDRFVKEHPYGWVCHLSNWKTLLETSFPHMKGYYLTLADDSGVIQAGLPIYHMKSWITGNRVVSIPLATLCDPLVSTKEHMHLLLQKAEEIARQAFASSIEIRAFHAPDLLDTQVMDCESKYRHHYLNLDMPLDKMMKSFHRTCIQQAIRRAAKNEMQVSLCSDPDEFCQFYKYYALTRKKIGRPAMPFVFFELLHQEICAKGYAEVLIARYKGDIKGGLISLKFKDRVSAEWIGSDPEILPLGINHSLFWEAITRAHNEGYAVFDFGRTALSNESLMTFKSRWATQELPLPMYYYPKKNSEKVNIPIKPLAKGLFTGLCKVVPNSAYQRIGQFCYKHLG